MKIIDIFGLATQILNLPSIKKVIKTPMFAPTIKKPLSPIGRPFILMTFGKSESTAE